VANRTRWRKVAEKTNESLREIGILLIAFVPLDFVLAGSNATSQARTLTGFFVAGVLLFVLTLVAEWRMTDAD
jgi:hypothetical protein